MSRNPYVADLTTTLADRWGLPRPEWVGIPEAPVDPNEPTPIHAAVVRDLNRPRRDARGRFVGRVQ